MTGTYLADRIRIASHDRVEMEAVAAQVERLERFVDTLVAEEQCEAQSLSGLLKRLNQ